MSPELHLVLTEIFAAESSLWDSKIDQRSVCEGRQALRRAIDILQKAVPDLDQLRDEISAADGLLLGRAGCGIAMQALRRAALHLQSINNLAPLERGRVA